MLSQTGRLGGSAAYVASHQRRADVTSLDQECHRCAVEARSVSVVVIYRGIGAALTYALYPAFHCFGPPIDLVL